LPWFVGFAASGDAEQNLRAVVAADAFDQFLDRVGWSPFGSYSDLMTKGTPPFDFSGVAAGAASRFLSGRLRL